MGLLNIFSSKNPENYEIKGDKFVETGAYGKAILEYEHALQRLEKTAPWDDGFRQNLQEKMQSCRESLALEHKKTAEDMLEAGYDEDARQYIQLALELTENSDIIGDLETHKREIESRALEGIQIEEPEVEIADPEYDRDDEAVDGDSDDEYFTALVGTLPEDIQKAYLDYGDAFKKGYAALNLGDFESAATFLSQALEENSDPQNYIPLELATACLNLGKFEDRMHCRPISFCAKSFGKPKPLTAPSHSWLTCRPNWQSLLRFTCCAVKPFTMPDASRKPKPFIAIF
jgi:tetratricopeptide (TPR) repeat protein